MAPVSAKSGGSVSALAALLRRRPKLWLAGALAVVLLVLYPLVIGGIVAHMVASRIGARLGRPVTIAQGRGGLGRFVLRGFAVGDAPSSDSGDGKSQAKSQEKPGAKSDAAPLVTADEILVPFSAAWGGSPITVIGLRVNAVRGGDADNVSDIVTRLRGKHGGADGASPSASSSSSVPGVRVESGSVSVQDSESGLVLKIAGIAGLLAPGRQASVRLRGVSGLIAVGGGDKGPRFGATELDIRTALASGLHRQGYPMVRIQDGFATPLPTLALTGITGTVGPPPTAAGAPSDTENRGVVIDLHGSYGGARESLWTAKGTAQPANREGRLSLRAAQFSLDKIADVLPRSVLSPARSNIDAAFDLTWAGESVRFGGDMAVTGLSLQHDALSSEPIEGMSLGLVLRGVAYPQRRRVELELLEGRLRNLVARITGSVELPRGKYVFSDGSHLEHGAQDRSLRSPCRSCHAASCWPASRRR